MDELTKLSSVHFQTKKGEKGIVVCIIPGGAPIARLEEFLTLLRTNKIPYSRSVDEELKALKQKKSKTIRPEFREAYHAKYQEITELRQQAMSELTEWKQKYQSHFTIDGDIWEQNIWDSMPSFTFSVCR